MYNEINDKKKFKILFTRITTNIFKLLKMKFIEEIVCFLLNLKNLFKFLSFNFVLSIIIIFIIILYVFYLYIYIFYKINKFIL
jgi:hypothetical protein